MINFLSEQSKDDLQENYQSKLSFEFEHAKLNQKYPTTQYITQFTILFIIIISYYSHYFFLYSTYDKPSRWHNRNSKL